MTPLAFKVTLDWVAGEDVDEASVGDDWPMGAAPAGRAHPRVIEVVVMAFMTSGSRRTCAQKAIGRTDVCAVGDST